SIFEAQMMMVSDETILKTIRDRIRDERRASAYVVDTEFSKFQHMLQTGDNPLMRERVDDVEDIKQRLLRYLLDKEKWLSRIEEPSIIVAEFLTPADAILFARANVLGYALDGGGQTSHVAILARSLGIPAIVAMHSAASYVETGDLIILDGERGELIVNPDAQTLEGYEREQGMVTVSVPDGERMVDADVRGARTKDGKPICIHMNLEFGSDIAVDEAERVSKLGTEDDATHALGLGLVRTEHFLLLNDYFPTEEEQTTLYKELVDKFYPAPITLRTFDVGGDKVLSSSYREDNPFLGWRGIRISLDEPEMFLAQLRAILRASARGNAKLLLPMITNLNELNKAIQLLETAKETLDQNGEPYDSKMPVGAMIEVPSAALMAHALAKQVDFFSIGTNDLTQYTLAVDRGNDLIANLFQEMHPAVLRLIAMTVKAGQAEKKGVSVCGELGSQALATPLLIGMGIDEISVSPAHVASLAKRIRSISYEECKVLTDRVLTEANTSEEVRQMVLGFLTERQLLAPFSESVVNPRRVAKV
ncbi:MAG TPA: phosphoenolpyruvate--protein phosphotransferase, partial [Candidatus Kapabacteria bacterium]|nr:phosphoenolpyruvate--protein phosphotransferase [Candidatus Kapabacteria bacterium]